MAVTSAGPPPGPPGQLSGLLYARLLQAFLDTPGRPRYETELRRHPGLGQPFLGAALARLTRLGWLTARAEPPGGHRGPRRRPYILTPAGLAAAPAAVAAARDHITRLAAALTPPAGSQTPSPRHTRPPHSQAPEAGP